jgi:DNA-binding NarL/FixJ family response regulator
MITILLADDHNIVRQGIRALLEQHQDIQIVGEASDGFTALDLVQKLRPDILLLDIRMPGLKGLEVAKELKDQNVPTRTIILSMYDDESYVAEAFRNGVVGYVLKVSLELHLIQAIHEAMKGRNYLSPPLSQLSVEAYVEKAKETSLDLYHYLTTRERQVLHLVVDGRTATEIAELLFISPRTVETHRSNLMQKLHVHNHTELILYAIRKGITSEDY